MKQEGPRFYNRLVVSSKLLNKKKKLFSPRSLIRTAFQQFFPEKETNIVNVHLVESFIRVRAIDAEIKSYPIMRSDSRIDLTKLFDDSMLAETGKVSLLILLNIHNLVHELLYD